MAQIDAGFERLVKRFPQGIMALKAKDIMEMYEGNLGKAVGEIQERTIRKERHSTPVRTRNPLANGGKFIVRRRGTEALKTSVQ